MTVATRALAQRIVETPPSATVLIADIASEMRRSGINVIDFSAGRAVESTPDYISRAASEAMLGGDTHQTPAQGKPEFREACARKLARENGIDADPDKNIIATLGCKQGLTLALMATINAGDEVIVEDPCFVSYAPTIRFCGGTPVSVPLRRENNFRWAKDELEAAVTKRTRAILFCSPHNPTGIVHTKSDLDTIAEIAERHNLYVIADEIYERVTWNGRRHVSIATRLQMRNRAIGLMGLTKSFAMGGWRIGFAYAAELVIQAMTVAQQHLMTCAGAFAQTGAITALGDTPPPEVTNLWQDWERRCEFVVAELNQLPGVSCQMPEGGFYAWINVSEIAENSEALAKKLLIEHAVAIVPGSAFGAEGEGFLRMTCVKSWDDLRAGLERLKQGLK